MIEQTLVLIKPDGVMKGVVEDIVERYRQAGLQVVQQKDLLLQQALVENLYQEHKGKFYFEGLVLSMISGKSVALLLAGENAIGRVRELNGATDPAKAGLGTIRRDFRSAGGPFNTVHGSDKPESARREISIVFGE